MMIDNKDIYRFVKDLHNEGVIGVNPLVFLNGRDIGHYQNLKTNQQLLNTCFCQQGFINRQSDYSKKIWSDRAKDGVLFIDKGNRVDFNMRTNDLYIVDGIVYEEMPYDQIDMKKDLSVSSLGDVFLNDNLISNISMIKHKVK